MSSGFTLASAIFSIVAGIPAIIYAIVDFLKLAKGDWGASLTHLIISLEIVLLLGWIVRREIKTQRKYKFHSVVNHLHEITHTIRDTQSYLIERISDYDRQELDGNRRQESINYANMKIQHVLDELKMAYSRICQGKIRVTIKAIVEDNGRLYTYALARDSETSRICADIDRKRLKENQDPIEKNSDFDIIYSNDERFFHSNNLPKKKNYLNSSIVKPEELDISKSKMSKIGSWIRVFIRPWSMPFKSWICAVRGREPWTLPYKSTYVWPIRQPQKDELPPGSGRCVAFLAVDSNRTNTFIPATDFDLGAAVADALFHPLHLCNKLSDGKD